MTLYLTEATDPADVAAAAKPTGVVAAVKLYPAGATTNSASGVTRHGPGDAACLERMAEIGMPLCVHGEVTDPEVDIFDREAAFIDRVLAPLRARCPGCSVVLEHITTAEGVALRRGDGAGIGAHDHVHHLILNRNHIFAGGIRPHFYCLPIVKRERHRLALRARGDQRATPRFFLGTDSAPHPLHTKEAACGCAGVFTAPVALAGSPRSSRRKARSTGSKAFASLNGPALLRPAAQRGTITLERRRPDRCPKSPCSRRSTTGAGQAVSASTRRSPPRTGASSTERKSPCSPTASPDAEMAPR